MSHSERQMIKLKIWTRYLQI